MDKRWMSQHRQSGEYSNGVNLFLEFAFSNSARGYKILCPLQDLSKFLLESCQCCT
ncbi:hypothetical protein PR202_gn00574 [Eleusine coracana subsp. coracana]|uniref:Transposase-associated domain-containing protein n=1 Tax=Eleusine coracana subsp. coracana TaxID=191504 RepID=A0AAV5G303_ELECO|nr:hypothetical protein PR202_gn00574 [Eleusine coracana subsp. coracana]